MITNYPVKQGKNRPGQVDGVINHENTTTRTNPALAQWGTLTVGGTAADGTYSAVFTPVTPGSPTITVEFVRGDGETNTQISAAIYADAIKKFVLVAAVTTNGALVTTIKLYNTDVEYTVETSAPGGATFVWAQTQAAGGSLIAFGRFLIGDGTGEGCKYVTGSTVVGDIIGVSAANYQTQQASGFNADPDAEDGIPAGREVSVYGTGPIDVLCEQAVTPADTLYIRIVANGDLDKLGIVRKDTDGGNAISGATIAQFTDSCAAGETVRVKVHIPLPKP